MLMMMRASIFVIYVVGLWFIKLCFIRCIYQYGYEIPYSFWLKSVAVPPEAHAAGGAGRRAWRPHAGMLTHVLAYVTKKHYLPRAHPLGENGVVATPENPPHPLG